MAALTVNHVVSAGTAPTFEAAAAGDTAEIGSGTNTFLVVKNASAATVDVTIASDLTLDSGADYPDKVVTVAAISGSVPGEAWIPLVKDYDSGGSAPAGSASVSYEATTDVTVALVRRS